jgi:transketolase
MRTDMPDAIATRSAGAEELGHVDGRYVDAPLAKVLVPLAADEPRIVGLTADLGRVTDMDPFRDAYPDRYFNVGMAEFNMISVASGLAQTGKIAFATTFGTFASRRAYESVMITAAHSALDVKIIACKPGLTNSYGATHQPIEDTALMRMIPDMHVIDPADAIEFMSAVRVMAETPGTFYIRGFRGRVPAHLPKDYEFVLGKAALLRDGTDVGIISSGMMTPKALAVADRLAAEGVDVAVLHTPSIKPFDHEAVASFASDHERLVAAENHRTTGGMISLVAETLCDYGLARRFAKVGLADEYFECGSEAYLEARHGIDEAAVERAVREAIA